MICLDCASAGLRVDAVAACTTCGAGACADHAVVRPHHLTRTVPVNQVVTVEPPARVVRCTVCDAAHSAHDDHRH